MKTLLQTIVATMKAGTTVTVSDEATKYLWAWILKSGGVHVKPGVLSSNEWEITFKPSTRKGYWRLSAVSQRDLQDDSCGEHWSMGQDDVMPKDRELSLEVAQ